MKKKWKIEFADNGKWYDIFDTRRIWIYASGRGRTGDTRVYIISLNGERNSKNIVYRPVLISAHAYFIRYTREYRIASEGWCSASS